MSQTTVRDVIRLLEQIASPELAANWDNTGLLLGDAAWPAGKILTCLTLTPDVATEAIVGGVQMIVTHHPILFKPVQRFTSQTAEGAMLLDLARAGISVYSPHTSWDDAPTGINQQLAELLGLGAIEPLRVKPLSAACKIITFVPAASLNAVLEALWQAGAGTIGEYSRCSFHHSGTGTFQGSAATNPTVGQAGVFEAAPEERLEVLCPKSRLEPALQALRQAHPYEEPAIDVIALEPLSGSWGSGRQGVLAQPVTLREFAEVCRDLLHAGHLMVAGEADRPVQRVAIACGSAGEYLADAHRAGCDVFVTGEARFHTALDACGKAIGLILAGHYATEQFAMKRLAERLKAEFPKIEAFVSQVERDPVWFC
jgi:dinuclear metal center YbgI/SA1388 family protein